MPPDSITATVRPRHVERAREQRRERDRAAGLDDQLEMAEGEGHRTPRVVVGGREAARDEAPVEREGQLARRRRQQRIADRAALRRVALALARGERAERVVEARGLDREHLDARAELGEREAAAGGEPAAAAGDQRGVGDEAQLARLLGDLEAGGALARDDPRGRRRA